MNIWLVFHKKKDPWRKIGGTRDPTEEFCTTGPVDTIRSRIIASTASLHFFTTISSKQTNVDILTAAVLCVILMKSARKTASDADKRYLW